MKITGCYRLVGTGVGNREQLPKGYRVSFWGDEVFWCQTEVVVQQCERKCY